MVQDCPICLQPISSPWGVSVPCGHPFHRECWDVLRANAIRNGRRPSCAVCKTPSNSFVAVFMDMGNEPEGSSRKGQPPRQPTPQGLSRENNPFSRSPTSNFFLPMVISNLERVTHIGIQQIPDTTFTIVPSDTPAIYSSPLNLILAKRKGKWLFLTQNVAVSSTLASGRHVRIGLPSHKLIAVQLCNTVTAQIDDGFTSLKSLNVAWGSTLNAKFTCSAASLIKMNVTESSKAILSSNVNTSVYVSGGSVVSVEAPTLESINLGSFSTLKVKGNVGLGGMNGDVKVVKVSGSSTLSVTGRI